MVIVIVIVVLLLIGLIYVSSATDHPPAKPGDEAWRASTSSSSAGTT